VNETRLSQTTSGPTYSTSLEYINTTSAKTAGKFAE